MGHPTLDPEARPDGDPGSGTGLDQRYFGEPSMETLACRFSLPVRLDATRRRYIPVLGIFRRLEFARPDRWLLDPLGRPRRDEDLAAEVLLELRQLHEETGATFPLEIDLAEVVRFDQAAAIIVSAYLSQIPRG